MGGSAARSHPVNEPISSSVRLPIGRTLCSHQWAAGDILQVQINAALCRIGTGTQFMDSIITRT